MPGKGSFLNTSILMISRLNIGIDFKNGCVDKPARLLKTRNGLLYIGMIGSGGINFKSGRHDI